MIVRLGPVASVTAVILSCTAVVAAERPTLDLQDCVRIALENSLQLSIAGEQVEIADEGVKQAWGGILPSVSVSASYSKSDRTDYDITNVIYEDTTVTLLTDQAGQVFPLTFQQPVGRVVEDVSVEATSKDVRANADLTLFDGFATWNSIAAAKASREAATLDQDYTRALVVQNVGMAYYNLLRYLTLRDVKIEDRDRAALELERSETYFRLGSAARADVLQQRVRLENTRLELVIAENAVEQAFADLAYAMSRPLAESFDIDRSSLQAVMDIEPLEALFTEAIANRADLQASGLTAEARRKDAAVATGALLPRVDLFASYARQNNESPYRFGSQTSQSVTWGGQVSMPIFNRYQNWGRRAQARAQARIAEYTREQAERDALLEVRRFHISMVEAKERLEVSRQTIAAAEEELRLAQERFRVGAGTQLERITAEVSLAQARADEVQAICDFLIARVQLYRALGRLEDVAQVLP